MFKDKPEKEKSLVEKVFSDKIKTSKATIKALLNEIELCENLDSHLHNNKKGLIWFDKPLSNIQF